MSSLVATIVIGYLVGAVVVGSVALGGALARGRTGLKTATILGIGAGGAWPLVVLGVVQWLALAAIIDAARRIARARACQPFGKAAPSTIVRRGSTTHPVAVATAVDQIRLAGPTRLISGSSPASGRTSVKNDTQSQQEPAVPGHSCDPVTTVELPGWGITFGPILVARLRRPTPRHIHGATASLTPTPGSK